jgi:hypothetical protein
MFLMAEDDRAAAEGAPGIFKVDWLVTFACAAYNLVANAEPEPGDSTRLTSTERSFHGQLISLPT